MREEAGHNNNFTSSISWETSNALKVIAIFTMLVDHTGAILFPGTIWFRIIGRIAFPLFAFQLAVGYIYTKSVSTYAKKLLIFGVISQIPYMLAFKMSFWHLNIFFTLFLGLLAMYFYDRHLWVPLLVILAASALDLIGVSCSVDYGLYGILTVLAFHVFSQNFGDASIVTAFLNGMYVVHFHTIQPFSLAALPIIVLRPKLRMKIPPWLFYTFYPTHLLLLCSIRFFIAH